MNITSTRKFLSWSLQKKTISIYFLKLQTISLSSKISQIHLPRLHKLRFSKFPAFISSISNWAISYVSILDQRSGTWKYDSHSSKHNLSNIRFNLTLDWSCSSTKNPSIIPKCPRSPALSNLCSFEFPGPLISRMGGKQPTKENVNRRGNWSMAGRGAFATCIWERRLLDHRAIYAWCTHIHI